MSNKIKQTQEELKNQLNEQLEFLKMSAKAYDEGFVSEAKRMATTVRVLLHDTTQSHSLLSQLDLKNIKFYSARAEDLNGDNNKSNTLSYHGLVGVSVGGENGYVPHFDNVPGGSAAYVDFDRYWSETIFVDKEGNRHNRKDIILAVANQDGGSHVDPGLNENYAKLSRMNSLGWLAGDDKGNWVPVRGAELAAIRQVAHEMLRTLVPDYQIQKNVSNKSGFVIGGLSIKEQDDLPIGNSKKKFGKRGRNTLCPCGSGIKYKKCCGK
jgi:hypothetical protein